MRTLSTPRLAVALAVIAGLMATSAVAGAAGAALIIGQSNGAGSSQTTLNSTSGGPTLRLNNNGTGRGLEVEADQTVPLRLMAPGGTAPMIVNTTTKVVNLNADRLDGLNSTAFLRANAQVSGRYTCYALDMTPVHSTTDYTTLDEGRTLADAPSAGSFRCGLHLPDGATITSLTCHLKDESGAGVSGCSLYRLDLNSIFGNQLMATRETDFEDNHGKTSLTDASVDHATVDNSEFFYFVECHLGGAGAIAAFGATVNYTFTGLPVE